MRDRSFLILIFLTAIMLILTIASIIIDSSADKLQPVSQTADNNNVISGTTVKRVTIERPAQPHRQVKTEASTARNSGTTVRLTSREEMEIDREMDASGNVSE